MPPTKRLCSLDDRGTPEASDSGAGGARELFQQLFQVAEDFFRCGRFLCEFQSPIGAELCAALRSHESRQAFGIDRGGLAKFYAHLLAFAFDGVYSHAYGQKLQLRIVQKIPHCQRWLAVAIDKFGAYIVQLRFTLYASHALVHSQTLVFLRNVIGRNANIEAEIELGRDLLLRHFALHLTHGAVEHLGVEFESHRLDVPALLAPQQVARTTQLQVESGDLEACAQVRELLQRGQTSASDGCEIDFRRQQQIGIRPPVRPSHAAAQLIKLGKPQPLRAINKNGVAKGDIKAVFDDGGRD